MKEPNENSQQRSQWGIPSKEPPSITSNFSFFPCRTFKCLFEPLELIEEYENNEGDMDIVCLGGEIQKCHSCVISCQSPIMRRSIENNLGRDQLNCTKFSKQTMAKLLQIMYCSDASFDYANEMIEVRYLV